MVQSSTENCLKGSTSLPVLNSHQPVTQSLQILSWYYKRSKQNWSCLEIRMIEWYTRIKIALLTVTHKIQFSRVTRSVVIKPTRPSRSAASEWITCRQPVTSWDTPSIGRAWWWGWSTSQRTRWSGAEAWTRCLPPLAAQSPSRLQQTKQTITIGSHDRTYISSAWYNYNVEMIIHWYDPYDTTLFFYIACSNWFLMKHVTSGGEDDVTSCMTRWSAYKPSSDWR